MQKEITFNTHKVSYTLRKSKRARRVNLSVHPGGRVVLSVPVRVPVPVAEAFLRQQRDWLLATVSYFSRFKPLAPKRHSGRPEYLIYKERARQLVHERLAHFNERYGFRYKTISIRNQKTRWGSCSKRGTLSFNYRLALLPPHLADYVVVHELCHLAHLDHSPKFWQLVARTIPDYAARKRELRAVSLR